MKNKTPTINISPLAIQRPAKRKRILKNACFGVAFHTMGRGILKRAKRDGMTPEEAALKWYRAFIRSRVNYIIPWDGTIYQLLGDNKRGSGIGMKNKDIRKYKNGTWRQGRNPTALVMWDAMFPNAKSPLDLFEGYGKRPSDCYIGVELMPLPSNMVKDDGLFFTEAQHNSARELAWDLAARHEWPDDWCWSGRLATHEILAPHSRWETEYTDMPWDPGAMREKPRFDMSVIWADS